jgi:uncharacterized protein (TIGR02246 family)
MTHPMSIEAPESLHGQFEEAFNNGDLDALVALYEESGLIAAAPGLVARGRSEIRTALAQYLAAGGSIEMETTSVIETGDGIALLNGKWHLNGMGPDGNRMEMSGANSEIVRRQPDGRWLFLIDNPFSA